MRIIITLLLVFFNLSLRAQGCLEAPNGQWPEEIYVPVCNNMPQGVYDGLTGEYTMIQVTNGMEYTFSGYPNDFITIGSESGDEVLATGTETVTWTSEFDGNIRFYTHLDSDCGWDDDTGALRTMTCVDPVEPDYGCDQEYARFSNSGFLINGAGMVANDFFVPMEAGEYELDSIKILFNIPFEEEFSITFNVTIRNDDAGTPGTILQSFTDLEAELADGELPDHYYATIAMGGYALPVNTEADTRYWIALTANSEVFIFWNQYPHPEGWATATSYMSTDNGSTWEGTDKDGVMYIDGTCSALSLNDAGRAMFNYYPNPVKDYLAIETHETIKDVSIYNLAGQAVLQEAEAIGGIISTRGLASGFYVVKLSLEDGQTETFKIIKE